MNLLNKITIVAVGLMVFAIVSPVNTAAQGTGPHGGSGRSQESGTSAEKSGNAEMPEKERSSIRLESSDEKGKWAREAEREAENWMWERSRDRGRP